MADPVSFLNLLEQSQQIEYLLNLPEVDEDEKAELEHIYRSLKTREESKFDAIIGVLKECDKYTVQIIDEIVREPLGGAHRNHKQAAIRLKKALRKNLSELKEIDPDELVKLREEKFRKMGEVVEIGN